MERKQSICPKALYSPVNAQSQLIFRMSETILFGSIARARLVRSVLCHRLPYADIRQRSRIRVGHTPCAPCE